MNWKKAQIDIILCFKGIWSGYRFEKFDLMACRSNLLLLKSIKKDDLIISDRRGCLRLSSGKRETLFWHLANVFRGFGLKARVRYAIESTVYAFLYKCSSTLDPAKIKLVDKRKQDFLHELFEKIGLWKGCNWDLSELRHAVEENHRHSIVQLQIIGVAHKLTAHRPSQLLREVMEALNRGILPLLIIRGLSGTYLLRGLDHRSLAVFKPFDEEFGAPNFPSAIRHRECLGSRSFRRGMRSGEGMHREVGAYLVDQFIGLGIVPLTQYAMIAHENFKSVKESILPRSKSPIEKRGSLQRYIEGCRGLNAMESEEIKLIPPQLLHPIFVLDMIIGHSDRHVTNLLYNGKVVYAIDNGLSFSDYCDEPDYRLWQRLPQAQDSFAEKLKKKVEELDPEKLMTMLHHKTALSWRSLLRMKERIALLKASLKANLTPEKVASLFVAENLVRLKDYESSLKAIAEQIVSEET